MPELIDDDVQRAIIDDLMGTLRSQAEDDYSDLVSEADGFDEEEESDDDDEGEVEDDDER